MFGDPHVQRERYGRLQGPRAGHRRLPSLHVRLRRVRDRRIKKYVDAAVRGGRPVARPVAEPEPIVRLRRRRPGPRRRGLLHPECGADLPAQERPARRWPRPDRAAPAPARGRRGRAHGQELRADDRHRLGQVAGLHRADRRRRAAREDAERRAAPPGREGDRRLPDERPGQLAGRGAREVPAVRLPDGRRAGHVRPVHRAGVARTSGGASWPTRRTSC